MTGLRIVCAGTLVLVAFFRIANSANFMRLVETSSVTLIADAFNESYAGQNFAEGDYKKCCDEALNATRRTAVDGTTRVAVFRLGDGRNFNFLECPAKPKPVYVLSVDIFDREPLLYAYHEV